MQVQRKGNRVIGGTGNGIHYQLSGLLERAGRGFTGAMTRLVHPSQFGGGTGKGKGILVEKATGQIEREKKKVGTGEEGYSKLGGKREEP